MMDLYDNDFEATSSSWQAEVCNTMISMSISDDEASIGSSLFGDDNNDSFELIDHGQQQDDEIFDCFYQLGQELGAGTFATVYSAQHRYMDHSCAVKVVDTRALSESQQHQLEDEVEILSKLSQHDSIVHLKDVIYGCTGRTYLILEQLHGGDLFDRIVERDYYTENKARQACANLLDALQYLHWNQIVHRDIKPENILLTSRHSDTDVKLADFGFATYCTKPFSLKTLCGTYGYKAPEIYLEKSYGLEVDMWSLGVVAYVLMAGCAPFCDDQDGPTSAAQICRGDYKFADEDWGDVSDRAIDFVCRLMTVSQTKRMTVQQAMSHAWIQEMAAAADTITNAAPPSCAKPTDLMVAEDPIVADALQSLRTEVISDDLLELAVKQISTPAAA